MYSRKHLISIYYCFLLFFVSTIANAQTKKDSLSYQIKVMGMNIGDLAVTQSQNGDTLRTKIVTDVKVKIIFTYRVTYYQTAEFINGELNQSHLKTIKNGKLNSESWFVQKDRNNYFFISQNDTTFINDQISYSGSLLYLNEPKQLASYYKENSGKKVFIKSTSAHHYQVTDSDGKKLNEYSYKKGILNEITINYPVATIHMTRNK